VGAAAALATLAETQRLNVADNAAARGDELLAGCRGLQDQHEIVGDVRGKGLMVCLELVADRESKQPIDKAAIQTALAAAYQEGVMIRISGNNIIISPALVITAEHVATIVAALDVGLTAAAKA
jgi:adenosylmethionine-8-amino-7-oxononanoate aminotransferase